MVPTKEFKLAQQIIELDIKRDELFEELKMKLGSQAYDILRTIQNHYDVREE
ncbi:hypothetical protein [Bacillus massilinigeriensis]|uniref:hypothetical protein n=1 Tax=Bacillus massilionigeriensis TaxID=1805475 RepID=UPI00156F38CD|nr:hypothetical protein [Bacillus massilionigeriensis]